MNVFRICLLLLISIHSFGQNASLLDLPAAHKNNMVEIQVEAVGGLYPTENLKCKIKNLRKKEMQIRIPPGLHFKSAISEAQDLITVREVLLVIGPGSEKEIGLKGYCMQAFNFSPSEKDVYHFSGYTPFPLKTLADSLDKYTPLDILYGQMFVWTISDSKPLYPIAVDSSLLAGAGNVMSYVANASSQAAASVSAESHDAGAVFTPSIEVFSKKAVLVFHNPLTQRLSFKLYNESGEELYSFFENRQLNHGIKHYTFGVNEVIPYGEEAVFYVKIQKQSGEIMAEMEVNENTEEKDVSPFKLSFPFQFELKKSVQYVKLNIYLEDGTLVEEFHRYKKMGHGKYNIHVGFMHLYPAGTSFIARLEDRNGTLYHEQLFK